jgi:hypothetical protein
MAITVNQSPADGQSAHFPLWHVVNSDLVGSTNLRCLFDIYIGGVFISRHKIYSPPDIGVNFYFDAAPIVRAYIDRYFNPTNAFYSWTTNDIYVEYQVQYGEQYTTSGGTVVTNASQASTTHKAYNCYSSHLQAGSLVVMGAGHQCPTDRDLTQVYFAPSYSFFLPYLRAAAASTHFFFAHSRDSTIFTQGTLSSGGILTGNLGKLTQLRISRELFTSVNPAYFTDATQYVQVEFGNGTAPSNFIVRADVWCNPKHEPIVLTFLNRYGAYESFVFGLVNKLEVEYERNAFQPTGWVKTSESAVIPPPDPSFYIGGIANLNTTTKVYNPTDSVFSIRHKYSYKLISDFVTETNYNWLKQLVASPSVYMEQGGYFYPVRVRDDKWTQKKSGVDKMFNLEITIDSFNNIYSNG